MSQTPTRPQNLEAVKITSALAKYMGMKTTFVSPERVEAELRVAPNLLNRNGALHGGVIMALADNTGGSAAFIALNEDETTTTTESKTNFLRAIQNGELIKAVATPLHIGRSMQVWQTNIYKEDGSLAAQVTQSQMTLKKRVK